jgi:spermidine/putrescine transport system substrate-binding protein
MVREFEGGLVAEPERGSGGRGNHRAAPEASRRVLAEPGRLTAEPGRVGRWGGRAASKGEQVQRLKGVVVRHPRERARRRDALGRRDFLQRVGAASLAAPAAASLLAACAGEPRDEEAAALEIARPNRPVTLPLFDDNPPIADGLSPERHATLTVFNWAEYVRPHVVKDFAEKYRTKVKISTFENMDEARRALERGADYDVMFLRVDVVGKLVNAKLLRPLNQTYLPNLEANIWPVYRNPFYDQEARYTVPYTLYTTGIAWRVDQVDIDIAALGNPYDIYWDDAYRGKINLFDDYREVIAMALLRDGVTNLNTGEPAVLGRARGRLEGLAGLIGALSIDAYSNLPQNRAWVHQAYSGDMVAAPYYFPKGEDPSVVRFWAPEDGRGAVGNDVMGVLRGSRNPVLAHTFINYLLDHDVSMRNYQWNGYQPPLRRLEAGELIEAGLVPPYLRSAIVSRRDFNRGFMELELDRRTDALWHRIWSSFLSAVRGR